MALPIEHAGWMLFFLKRETRDASEGEQGYDEGGSVGTGMKNPDDDARTLEGIKKQAMWR